MSDYIPLNGQAREEVYWFLTWLWHAGRDESFGRGNIVHYLSATAQAWEKISGSHSLSELCLA